MENTCQALLLCSCNAQQFSLWHWTLRALPGSLQLLWGCNSFLTGSQGQQSKVPASQLASKNLGSRETSSSSCRWLTGSSWKSCQNPSCTCWQNQFKWAQFPEQSHFLSCVLLCASLRHLLSWAALAVSIPKFLYPIPNIISLHKKIHLKNTWRKYQCEEPKSQKVHSCFPPWRGQGEDKDWLHLHWVSQSPNELLIPMGLTVDDTAQLFVTGTHPSPPSCPQNLPFPDLDQIFQQESSIFRMYYFLEF